MKERPSSSDHLPVLLIRAILQLLRKHDGTAHVKVLIREIESMLELDEWARTRSARSSRVRWITMFHFLGLSCKHRGLIRKTGGGYWSLTDKGYELLDQSESDFEAEIRKHRKWRYPTGARPLKSSIVLGSRVDFMETSNNYAVVKVFYATDRNMVKDEGKIGFGNERGDSIRYGDCLVSIPHDHRMGRLERPLSILRFEFGDEDPEHHVVLHAVRVREKDVFYERVRGRIDKSGRKAAFLFVHGYNVSFAEAARRTAQIHYDLQFAGSPVFYSWPSQGETIQYVRDEENIKWSEKNLEQFLDEFARRSRAQEIYIIAHSMGNRSVTGAIAALARSNPSLRAKYKELILAAPDIDAEIFVRDIAPFLSHGGDPITLYCSENDRALRMSQKIRGYPRAGDAGASVVIYSGIETIDASKLNTDFLGHSYFASNKSVLSDLYYLINNRLRACDRYNLRRVILPNGGAYWKFDTSFE